MICISRGRGGGGVRNLGRQRSRVTCTLSLGQEMGRVTLYCQQRGEYIYIVSPIPAYPNYIYIMGDGGYKIWGGRGWQII